MINVPYFSLFELYINCLSPKNLTYKMMKIIVVIPLFFATFFTALPVSAANCQQYREIYQCPGHEKYPVHISFDDGPADVTPDVLAVLAKENIPATFFAIAEKLDCEAYASKCLQGDQLACEGERTCQARHDILQQVKKAGHHIGSHSYWHVRHSTLSSDEMAFSIARSKEILSPYLNTQPPLFRLPNGDGFFNQQEVPEIMQAVNEKGFKHIGWEISAFDWRESDQQGDRILKTVMQDVCKKKRGVILFHDGVHDQPHKGRIFTTEHIGEWVPILKCVADFKPLEYFFPDIKRH
jgi:peptidoglycan/xylan/chitin deacetylase (PgdA/CDA1 family)